jgi:hypothetical protein
MFVLQNKNKNAAGLYGVEFKWFSVLEQIYGRDRATGNLVEDVDQSIRAMEENTPKTREAEEMSSGDEIRPSMAQVRSHSSKTPPSTSSSKKRKRLAGKGIDSRRSKSQMSEHSLEAQLGDCANKFMSVVEQVGSHFKTMADMMVRHDERVSEDRGARKKIIDELMQIDGITSGDVIVAAEILLGDPSKLELFTLLPSPLRRQFIVNLIHSPH